MFDVDLGAHMKITESELNEHGSNLTTVQTGMPNTACLFNRLFSVNLYVLNFSFP